MNMMCTFDDIYQVICDKANLSDSTNLILIGGCSRSGKTTLANNIATALIKNDLNALVVNIDSWIVSIEKRKLDSTVMERYESESIICAVKNLLRKKKFFHPIMIPYQECAFLKKPIFFILSIVVF